MPTKSPASSSGWGGLGREVGSNHPQPIQSMIHVPCMAEIFSRPVTKHALTLSSAPNAQLHMFICLGVQAPACPRAKAMED